MHRYEIDTPYMDEFKWDNVDKLIFVNPELEGLFKNRVKKQIDTITIPNAIDISKFHYNAPSEENSLLAFSVDVVRNAPHKTVPIRQSIQPAFPSVAYSVWRKSSSLNS